MLHAVGLENHYLKLCYEPRKEKKILQVDQCGSNFKATETGNGKITNKTFITLKMLSFRYCKSIQVISSL